MQRASRVIGSLAGAGGALSAEEIVRAAWPGAVGEKIAAHTAAVKLVRANLVVEVEDAMWRRNLMTLGHQIRSNLARAIGPGIVEDLEFRIVPRRRGPQRAVESAAARPFDDADAIADPGLRRLYKTARKRG